MNKKMAGAFILVPIILLLSAGCSGIFKPTYTKESIPSSIKKICRQDYGITEKLDVKIKGHTLGAKIYLENLIDVHMKMKEDALDKLQKLLRVIRRVCLSTDAELDFFVITGYEEKLGIEVVFYSYVDDLKRLSAGWMSPDDYFQRLVRAIHMDTLRWGKVRISRLIRNIEKRNMMGVIVDNFIPGIRIASLDKPFMEVLLDMNKKSWIKWNVIETRSVQTKAEERMFYVKAVEYFAAAKEKEKEIHYPSGTTHKFYILITTEGLNPLIKGIYTKNSLPEGYQKLGDPDTWEENNFFVEDFVFHKFLSNQIIQRIEFILNKDKKKKSTFFLKGNFVIMDKINKEAGIKDPSGNIFKISITPKNTGLVTLKEVPQKLVNTVLDTIRDVCRKYKFYNLGKIELTDENGKVLLSVDKPALFSTRHNTLQKTTNPI